MNLLIRKKTFLLIYLIIMLIGYEVITTILLPVGNGSLSRSVTIPFRFFQATLSLVVLFFLPKKQIKVPSQVWILLIYFILLSTRVFYDLNFQFTEVIALGSKERIWSFLLLLIITPCLVLILGYRDIEYMLLRDLLQLTLILLVSYIVIQRTGVYSTELARAEGSAGLNSINLGGLGSTTFLISYLGLFTNKNKTVLRRLFLIFGMVMALILITRSGSRGALLGTLLLYLLIASIKSKTYIFKLGLISIFLIPMIWILINISPYIFLRLTSVGLFDSRIEFYSRAWGVFIKSPLIGSQFAFINNDGSTIYAHNLFLDSMMGLGLIGLALLSYLIFSALKIVIKSLKLNQENQWIGILFLQELLFHLVSGAIYLNPLFSFTLVLVFLSNVNNSTHNRIK